MKYELITEEILLKPIPVMDDLRERKKGYSMLPIDITHPLFNEPVIGIAEYGLAGQAYYSRPNIVTGVPVPGVPVDLYLRRSVAATLAKINIALQHPAITKLFGGEVELYIEDALRPVALQRRLHDELIPTLLRRNHPGISDEDIKKRAAEIIAVPSSDPRTPSPHATGGALDIALRYRQTSLGYVGGSQVEMGHSDGETGVRINPDYFETALLRTDQDRTAQKNRRAFYAVMSGVAFGVDTGLTNNPTEWWHWGIGDQLSAKVRGDEAAYYSLAEPDAKIAL